jgi:magnesium transporter
MAKRKNRKSHLQKIGLPPGSLIHIGEQKTEKASIHLINFDENAVHEKKLRDIEEAFTYLAQPSVTWINIDGLHEVSIIDKLGQHLNIHPLVLEDILNTGHRPKIEDHGDYIHFVLKMLDYDEKSNELITDQLSLILGKNYVITFQEQAGDAFDPIRERLRSGNTRIKRRKADYLTYALIDAVVDSYFIILEHLGEAIETLEEDLLNKPTPETLHEIHGMKRKMILLRKSIWPLREVINALEREESALIQKSTEVFLKDVYDHTIQVIDTVETYRDMVTGMLDIYLSNISNRMNEVMKILTIITTIFIPLSFIAGIYGMNFRYMPELEWRWAYFSVWLVMLGVAGIMIYFFKKKRWF